MSLWIPRRDKNGRLHIYSVGLPLSVILMAVGAGLGLLMVCMAVAPTESIVFFLGMTGLGFVLFLTAKVSVLRQGCFFSFGSAKMTLQMKTAYWTGWVLMVIGAALVLCTLWIASRVQSGL